MLLERRRSCADAFAAHSPAPIRERSPVRARNRAKRSSLPPVAGAPAGATYDLADVLARAR